MTSPRQERLKLALAGARQALGRKNVEGRRSLSPLNHLRGVSQTKDTRDGDLLSRTRVSQRPVFETVADKVLGQSSEWNPSIDLDTKGQSTLSQIASQRLASLRDRQTEQIGPSVDLGDNIGILPDGKQIWAEVLDRQRGYLTNQPTTVQPSGHFNPKWPPLLAISSKNTLQSWHVVAENKRASIASEKVVHSPGTSINPLLIKSTPGNGKSHLLHATAQAMLRRNDGNVHHISLSTLVGRSKLPDGWQDSMAHAAMVAIDDIHLAQGSIAVELGLMLDLALNLGVQIVLTSLTGSTNSPSGRLAEVMKSATSIEILTPSPTSLITHLRRLSTNRSLLMDDSMLARIVSHSQLDWRSCDALFEKVSLVIESGEHISSAEDISLVIGDSLPTKSDESRMEERDNLEDLAHRVVHDALDHVYTTSDLSGVELHAPINEVEDDWTVPEFDLASSDELQEKLTSDALTPHLETTFTIDEAEKFLLEEDTAIEGWDRVRVLETSSGIKNIADDMIAKATIEHENQALKLARLEAEMQLLANRSQEADVDELIEIADRLKAIDSELNNLNPLDEFIPDGEWNIDADDVSASDLLSRPILSTLKPLTILIPLEDSA
ncbi:MAG TPA: hypothetical protein EYQ73_05180 [Candidatus Poseidoniales archaeon]|jgi:chromosomal replication initiation ATPase DnaA|nr:MAG: hypothetical protein CXT71_08050 [Euryarchaeota archaeon]HIF46171.1 hypothetical protein [Candidatus Poseidoniales archaeon]HIL65134.1 hypothetical protein [Candidatus Poseidoniales archaeon]